MIHDTNQDRDEMYEISSFPPPPLPLPFLPFETKRNETRRDETILKRVVNIPT